METIKHEKTYLNFNDNGQFFLSAECTDSEDLLKNPFINTNVALFANTETHIEDPAVYQPEDLLLFRGIERTSGGFTVAYNVKDRKVGINENVEMLAGLNLLRQSTEVVNSESEHVRISKLSCANVIGIGLGGGKWFNDERFRVYYCYNKWQGEGQWRSTTLKNLGIYPRSEHLFEKSVFRLQSTGSYSTGEYYPLIVIEDREKYESWFFEREGASDWFFEIYAFGGFTSDSLSVSIGWADEKSGWKYDLQPGEHYKSGSCVYGVVKGGFNSAINELIAYKRLKSTVHHAMTKVVFNDYMNCNWATPDAEKLLPLIKKAAELGVECFCIDDGWAKQGEWIANDALFGKFGFKGILDEIKSRGMVAGIWFEFERADGAMLMANSDAIRVRDGFVIAPWRPKLNMCSIAVREMLFSRVDEVYKAGIRFIKNDHNNDEGVGSTIGDFCSSEGTIRNTAAFYSFIDELRIKYPDLILENCASGALREDAETLSRFELQSVSDQEDYRLNPSIVIGQMALIQPEKAGIWSYPYPQRYSEKDLPDVLNKQIKTYADGRQTIFNMVTSMIGYMYISGRIDLADDFNTALIKEAIDVYKSYNDTLSERFPSFVLPIRNIDDLSFNAFGLIKNNGEDMLLAVWALEQTQFELDLTFYGFTSLQKLYPLAVDNVNFTYTNKKITFHFNQPFSAALFKLYK